MVILSLLLIQEGQLSVSGERMCTILVNRLEDLAYPVNVWLGKLTALDMTYWVDLAVKPQHKHFMWISSLRDHWLEMSLFSGKVQEIFQNIDCWKLHPSCYMFSIDIILHRPHLALIFAYVIDVIRKACSKSILCLYSQVISFIYRKRLCRNFNLWDVIICSVKFIVYYHADYQWICSNAGILFDRNAN